MIYFNTFMTTLSPTSSYKISVVIPTYNRARTLERCISSVVAQSYSAGEILVVDDGSSDETPELIHKMDLPQLRYLRLKGRTGAQAARNFGIRQAVFPWIAFLDSDDEWLPQKLERQINALRESQQPTWTVIHSNGFKEAQGIRTLWEIDPVEGHHPMKRLVGSPGPLFQGVLLSREALEKIGYLNEHVPSYQEWHASLALARHCSFVHLKEPLFVYHSGSDTISSDYERTLRGYHFVRLAYEKETVNLLGREFFRDQLKKNLEKALQLGEWKLARKLLTPKLGYRTLLKGYLFSLLHITPERYHKIRDGYLRRRESRSSILAFLHNDESKID